MKDNPDNNSSSRESKPRLSIVIPCYNHGEILVRYLRQQIAIIGSGIEFVVVDDGSTDNSRLLLETLSVEIPALRLISQENAGAGAARNKAIPMLRGDYVMFLDADDEWDLQEILSAVGLGSDIDADLVFIPYQLTGPGEPVDGGMWSRDADNFALARISNTEFRIRDVALNLVAYPWNRIVSRELLLRSGIRFGNSQVHNDLLFHWHSICSARKIVFHDQVVCRHTLNDSGSLSSSRGNSRIGVFDAVTECLEILASLPEFPAHYALWEESIKELFEWNRNRIEPELRAEFDARLSAFGESRIVRDVNTRISGRENGSEYAVVLFTPYFRAGSQARQEELDRALRQNLDCSSIARIVLLIDDGHIPPIEHEKLEIINLEERASYAKWVELSARLGKGYISVLANSDICFDHTLNYVKPMLVKSSSFLASTRIEKIEGGFARHPDPHWSQDVWAYCTDYPVSPALTSALAIPMGVPRCDNKAAYLFAVHGWAVFNPVEYICAIHLHASGERNYDKQNDKSIIGAVAYVHPCVDLCNQSVLDLDVWILGSPEIDKLTLNRFSPRWITEKQEKSNEESAAIKNDGDVARISRTDATNNFAYDEIVFEQGRRFYLYRKKNHYFLLDKRRPDECMLFDQYKAGQDLKSFAVEILSKFIPPLVNIAPLVIRDRPLDPGDICFWQYPCATEREAWLQHKRHGVGSNIDKNRRLVHTYLALPWATWIDKKEFPVELLRQIRTNIIGLKTLAISFGYNLHVHTVCQHIYWQDFLSEIQKYHISDLHLSHCELDIQESVRDTGLSLHSWPLIAVNMEVSGRNIGMKPGLPLIDKKYLASFVGAYLSHYRSDARLRLQEEALRDGGKDILVEVDDCWYFENIVYGEQVHNRKLTTDDLAEDQRRTRYYNEILSGSVFSLCPEGAGPNTLRFWESLAVGAIPVVISDQWKPPAGKGALKLEDCAIFYPASQLQNLFAYLRSISAEEISSRQANCMQAYQEFREMTAF